jgi:hypothetical protein
LANNNIISFDLPIGVWCWAILPLHGNVGGLYRFYGNGSNPDGLTGITINNDLSVVSGWKNGVQFINGVAQSTTVTITFNANGGSVSPSTMTATSGQPLGTLPIPNRPTHNFLGWFTASVGGQQVTSSTPALNQSTTYFARWQQITPQTGSFSRLSGIMNALGSSNNGSSAKWPATSPTLPPSSEVTSVSVRLTVSSGSSPVHLWVESPEGWRVSKGTYGVGTHTVSFNEFNGDDPRGTWYTWIQTTGQVSSGTTNITVNYRHW